jgi:hypothetical protein
MDGSGFFAKIVRGELPQAPIATLLGWKFVDFDAEQQVIKVEMQARPEFMNPAGLIHGGMLAAMLDETLSPALAATLGPGEFAPTLEDQSQLRLAGESRPNLRHRSCRESGALDLLLGRPTPRRTGYSACDRLGDFEDRPQSLRDCGVAYGSTAIASSRCKSKAQLACRCARRAPSD